ncbi:MAG: nitroreductase family protein [Halieaceae bacterium]|nr:nitroreductase family protein [Halieaceae bacterium]
MNETIQQLLSRNSAPKLTEPGPDRATLDYMFQAALRAPDHAWLQPWRFITIEGNAREQLGEVFLESLLQDDPGADDAARSKAMAAPLRAPLLVVVVCRYTEHPKVPHQEQIISAGCAAQAMMLAAEAQGYAAIWRTGSYAEDPLVAHELGLADNESIVGFLYFGSREGRAKPLPERKVDDFVQAWAP